MRKAVVFSMSHLGERDLEMEKLRVFPSPVNVLKGNTKVIFNCTEVEALMHTNTTLAVKKKNCFSINVY